MLRFLSAGSSVAMLSSLKVPLVECVKVVVTVFLGYMLSNLADKTIQVYCIVSLCMLCAKFLWPEADMLYCYSRCDSPVLRSMLFVLIFCMLSVLQRLYLKQS